MHRLFFYFISYTNELMCFMTVVTVCVWIFHIVCMPTTQGLQPVAGNPVEWSQMNMFCLAHVDFEEVECEFKAREQQCLTVAAKADSNLCSSYAHCLCTPHPPNTHSHILPADRPAPFEKRPQLPFFKLFHKGVGWVVVVEISGLPGFSDWWSH